MAIRLIAVDTQGVARVCDSSSSINQGAPAGRGESPGPARRARPACKTIHEAIEERMAIGVFMYTDSPDMTSTSRHSTLHGSRPLRLCFADA